ncbi:hypothetical protein [Sphingobium lactosutens]|uniref:Uncharacterized protein n=1 Tax=Sphingobium lactosutens DS20 TaxID=1331060 RepID=T0HPM7_9SPHN|nr:hypothetical protein [Sphingobium lactosutens]EQB14992.1 hypothetical protein RLDS_12540 [Sphingobium lactosutens DS20]
MTELISQIKILFILTSASTMGVSDKPTGLWFEELATPYYAFLDNGASVRVGSRQPYWKRW